MNLIVLDGLYPSNPMYGLPAMIVVLFEAAVILLEVFLGVTLFDKIKTPDKRVALVTVIVIGNIVTFLLGVFLQFALFGGI